MDFIDKVQEIAQRIPKTLDHIQTEEATKSAFVMPFIQALGYDVFNPLEVVPEFVADHGTKKGEKVDYAIKKDDSMVMLIECKWCGANLQGCHASQLYRYFSVTEARFGILTNGIYYQFFSDLDEPNKMDSKPFFEFDMLDFDEQRVEELKKFTKTTFDLENILTTASDLKYTNAIKKVFREELDSPSNDFVRFFTAKVYSGRLYQQVIDQFTPIVKKALSQSLRERVNERIQTALNADQEEPQEIVQASETEVPDEAAKDGVKTTEEELESFNIVKAIVREVVDVKRVAMRDTKSYCGILLDDNNRKPICRLHFNTIQKYLGIIKNKNEERIPIDGVDDLFKHADSLKATVTEYLND
ncbi:MAG: restriction endonuclease [Desulfobacteraceae bacterium]|nr:restriction endonuclease [Desulfobacteraceae bacterium]MBC2750096.1 type I restriction enzyme HsdR N-terminal domain-containing protein [Desulfobacteraceae bacterium]